MIYINLSILLILTGKRYFRYQLKSSTKIGMGHNGERMECYAAKDGYKQLTGNVVSRPKRMTVHSKCLLNLKIFSTSSI